MTIKLAAATTFPTIEVMTKDQQKVVLDEIKAPYDWKMIVVYRGRHCPLCSRYLQQLANYKQELQDLGIDLIAVSADSYEQAQEHLQRMNINFPLAYGLTLEQMGELGLYISKPRSEKETDHPFPEPGLFVVNQRHQLQLVDISNGPFARPDLKTLVSGLSFIRDPANDYPIRGTY